VLNQDGWPFRLDIASGALCSHIVELVPKPLAFGAHFLYESHQFRSYHLKVSHKLFDCRVGDLPHLFSLIHDVNSFIMLGKNPVAVTEHPEAV
jgi:hypothetical protein